MAPHLGLNLLPFIDSGQRLLHVGDRASDPK